MAIRSGALRRWPTPKRQAGQAGGTGVDPGVASEKPPRVPYLCQDLLQESETALSEVIGSRSPMVGL